jgi:hypothetical protein
VSETDLNHFPMFCLYVAGLRRFKEASAEMAVTAAQYQSSGALRSGRWIEGCTTASVGLLAVIAAVVSYGHMHALALQHREGPVASALIPLSVDGMIVAASMSLLLDSRLGHCGGLLPWALLVTGAAASLAANIAAAEPTAAGRVIAAWPSFALTASYELLMRRVRRAARSAAPAAADRGPVPLPQGAGSATGDLPLRAAGDAAEDASDVQVAATDGEGRRVLQRRAWQWALANRRPNGSLPAGSEVARQFGRSERWGRLVTGLGRAGQLTPAAETITAA